MLFESSRESFRDLYLFTLDSGELLRLTDDPEGNFDPCWSPDGRQIAFASSRHGQLDLFVMERDGGGVRRLTSHPGDSVKPEWSPDGSRIAFISGRGGRDHLWTIRPDGSELTDLLAGTVEAESFAWRPDGQAVLVAARAADRKSKLLLIELASGRTRELSGPEHDDSQPAWAPDGEHLAFASAGGGRSDIWIMRADGKRRTRLTESGDAWLPRWLAVLDTKERGK